MRAARAHRMCFLLALTMSMSALPLELIAHIGYWASTLDLLSMRLVSKGVLAVITPMTFETVVFQDIPSSPLLHEDRFPDVLSHARRARLVCRGDEPLVAIGSSLQFVLLPPPRIHDDPQIPRYVGSSYHVHTSSKQRSFSTTPRTMIARSSDCHTLISSG
jgi:hypothetical protein